ncbi:MAG TPA: hypothetical protein VLI45_09290 [Acidobacteriaceae bacterium]|nr:hypothetical protein [Acidobacteriaceae bacterium]
MDIETVADLLDVSTRQIRTYVTQFGCPSRKEGRTPVFSWPEVLNWYVGYKSALEAGDRAAVAQDEPDVDEGEPAGQRPNEDIRQATLRKTRAEANLKELALSRLRSEVITIADAKVRLDRMLGNLRAKLLGMAPKLASRIEGLKVRTEREAAIKDEIEALCREISTGAIVDLPDEVQPNTVEKIDAAAGPEPAVTNADILRNVAELLEDYDDAPVQ